MKTKKTNKEICEALKQAFKNAVSIGINCKAYEKISNFKPIDEINQTFFFQLDAAWKKADKAAALIKNWPHSKDVITFWGHSGESVLETIYKYTAAIQRRECSLLPDEDTKNIIAQKKRLLVQADIEERSFGNEYKKPLTPKIEYSLPLSIKKWAFIFHISRGVMAQWKNEKKLHFRQKNARLATPLSASRNRKLLKNWA